MRRALAWSSIIVGIPLVAYGVASFSACSGGDNNSDGSVACGDIPDGALAATPCSWDQPVTRPDDTTATQNRAACTYKRGDMPAATLGSSSPVDKDIPITNVIVVMMENHSFDNYFGHLNQFLGRTDIESAPADAGNLTTDGSVAPYTHAPHLCTLDTDHEWDGTHLEWADGGMSGFAIENEGWSAGDLVASPDGGPPDPALASGARSMFYYDQTDLPFYYSLAQNFAIADHYHASALGPTWVNRMFFWAGTSFGVTANTFPDISKSPFPPDVAGSEVGILDELEERHADWWIYADALPTAAVVYGIGLANRYARLPQRRVHPNPVSLSDKTDFFDALAAGQLPSISFVDPDTQHENSDGQDEHPPADIHIGQKWVSDLVHAVMVSPQWAHTALFITWDEHGGFYDHLPPPPACVPDSLPTILNLTTQDTIAGSFDRYGVRVPLIVVSPYAKKGYVGHATYDHTSIARFIEAKFKIPAVSNRDANADAMMDLFDFSTPQQLTPPTIPDAVVDPTGLQFCESTYPHDGG